MAIDAVPVTRQEALVRAWGSWGPTLDPDGGRVAFVSDRRGSPELWLQAVPGVDQAPDPAIVVPLSADPVCSVSWSADGTWLACSVATNGGVRTQVWVVRPDGTEAHRVAGNRFEHATLGPWTRRGHRLVVTSVSIRPGDEHHCRLVDPSTGEWEPLARGRLVDVLDLSLDERFALLRDGLRGARFCVTLDRHLDIDHPVLTYPATGSTEAGLLRPGPESQAQSGWGDDDPGLTAYLVSEAGRPAAELVGVPLGPEGRRGQAGSLAWRADGELELLDADDAGRQLVLVWNVAGSSVVELMDVETGRRQVVEHLPGAVASSCVMARDGRSVVICVEGPDTPRQIWRLDTTAGGSFQRISELPPLPDFEAVAPTLQRFEAHDGLPLTGWLYRVTGSAGEEPGPVVISLHGGPEAQERPGFNPQHQALLAAGISVFAPNVRGSSGFGRAFAHADDRYGRRDAVADVESCVRHLTATGVADPARIAVSGRSYGGYLTLAALVRYPELFAAGVDICGMSDLLTFFRDTEPWIAVASVSKYGDPVRDRALLGQLSPLHQASRISAPVLVVHGQLDTNVPLGEATQIVAALRSAGRSVEYLELEGEGHEYRRAASRLALLERMTAFLAEHLGASPHVQGFAVGKTGSHGRYGAPPP